MSCRGDLRRAGEIGDRGTVHLTCPGPRQGAHERGDVVAGCDLGSHETKAYRDVAMPARWRGRELLRIRAMRIGMLTGAAIAPA